MKKLFFYSILSLLSTSLFAQDFKVAPVFGIHAATTIFSRVAKDDLDGAKILPIPGITIGALADYQLLDNLSVRSGLLLSIKGGKVSDKETISGVKYKMSQKFIFTYLELPLWVSYPIGESGFSVTGGPTIGFAVGAKQKYRISEDGEVDKDSDILSIGNDPYRDDVRPLDVSLNLGVAKEIEIAGKPFEISLNIQPSLTKWSTESKLDSDYWGRNLVVGVRAAYFFSLSR